MGMLSLDLSDCRRATPEHDGEVSTDVFRTRLPLSPTDARRSSFWLGTTTVLFTIWNCCASSRLSARAYRRAFMTKERSLCGSGTPGCSLDGPMIT